MQFYSTVSEYLLYKMESRSINGPFIATISPSNLVPTKEFSALPEWYIEDIADLLLFCMQYALDVVINYMDQSLITLVLTCVCAPQLINNPYIVAKYVEVLFVTSPTMQSQTSKLYYSVRKLNSYHINCMLILFFFYFFIDNEPPISSNCISKFTYEILHRY